MKLDKKQIPQLVVLGLLLLICIGYVSFKFMKPPAAGPAPAAKQSAKANTAGNALVQVQAEPVLSTATFPDLGAPIPRRDPFTVQNLEGVGAPKPNKPANSKANPVAQRAVRAASGRVPPLIPMGSFANVSAVQSTAVPSTANPDPLFVLTGVVRGRENVAIIRVGNSERYVVKQGQLIGGRYRVLSVSPDGVVLACKNRRIHLKLGGVPNAS